MSGNNGHRFEFNAHQAYLILFRNNKNYPYAKTTVASSQSSMIGLS